MKDLDLHILLDEIKEGQKKSEQRIAEAKKENNLGAEFLHEGIKMTCQHHITLVEMVIEKREISRRVNEMLND